jgi:hypothetical protein
MFGAVNRKTPSSDTSLQTAPGELLCIQYGDNPQRLRAVDCEEPTWGSTHPFWAAAVACMRVT